MNRHIKYSHYIIFLLLIDQVTKRMFFDKEMRGTIFIPVINTGAARSMPIPEWIIMGVGFLVSIYLIISIVRKEIHPVAALLFIAGTRSNLIDRQIYNGVRDFIHIGDRFPIFNIADCYITIAIIFMVRHEYKKDKKNQI